MPSLAEKIDELVASTGEIGQHRQTLIKMETAIEKVIRPVKTYLLMVYALRHQLRGTKDVENYTRILQPSRDPRYNRENTQEFIVLKDKELDVAYFYFHYDLERDAVYVTSKSVATQEISVDDVIKVLETTIGIDE